MRESNYLKDNIENIQKLFAIPALSNFETKALGRLIRLSKVRTYEDGECIIREGDNDKWLYFLLVGEVRITRKNVQLGKASKYGEMFGEMSFIDSLTRSASVHAVGDTTCLAVNTEATERLPTAGEAGNFLLMLYRVIAEYVSVRLRITNDELVEAKRQLDVLKKTFR